MCHPHFICFLPRRIYFQVLRKYFLALRKYFLPRRKYSQAQENAFRSVDKTVFFAEKRHYLSLLSQVII